MRYAQADHAETEYRKNGDRLSIRRYFDELKLHLVTSPIVESVEVISEKIGEKEGYLRVTIGLPDDSVMCCFEYVLSDGLIEISKYSFNWQDMAGNLICRWNNAPHHPELDNFSHNVHTKDKVSASSETNLIFKFGKNIGLLDQLIGKPKVDPRKSGHHPYIVCTRYKLFRDGVRNASVFWIASLQPPARTITKAQATSSPPIISTSRCSTSFRSSWKQDARHTHPTDEKL